VVEELGQWTWISHWQQAEEDEQLKAAIIRGTRGRRRQRQHDVRSIALAQPLGLEPPEGACLQPQPSTWQGAVRAELPDQAAIDELTWLASLPGPERSAAGSASDEDQVSSVRASGRTPSCVPAATRLSTAQRSWRPKLSGRRIHACRPAPAATA
jgi:hypothetical protein